MHYSYVPTWLQLAKITILAHCGVFYKLVYKQAKVFNPYEVLSDSKFWA